MTAEISLELDGLLQELFRVRRECGWPRAALVSYLDYSYDSLYQYETGRRAPPHSLLVRWAKLLDVDIPPGVTGKPPRPYNPCGTTGRYLWHYRRGERCVPCTDVYRIYQREYAAAKRRLL